MTTTTMYGWYLGNLSSIETDPDSILGTYGSAGAILSQNVITVDAVEFDGQVDENTASDTLSYDAGAGPVTLQLEEMVLYNVTVVTTDDVTHFVQLWAIQMTNGDVILLHDDDPSSDPFETTPIKTATITSTIGGDYAIVPSYHDEPVAPACFCSGTLIKTPQGECAVEDLAVGDRITTADHGAQVLRWIGVQRFDFAEASRRYMPVEIKPGALGGGVPKRVLLVSPQHRMLIQSETGDVLGPAKALRKMPGVRQRRSSKRVGYYCLLFDRHQIIFAEGAATESFRPGPFGIAGFSRRHQREIKSFYPNLNAENGNGLGPPARPLVTRKQAEQLISERKPSRRVWDTNPLHNCTAQQLHSFALL